MIYIENTEDKQRIFIPRSAVEVENLSPIPDELMGDYYTKAQVDNKVLNLQGQINNTNVEVQELEERVTNIEENGTGGGGSVDNEEIEKINQSIDDIEGQIDSMNLNITDLYQRFVDIEPNIYSAKATGTATNTLYAYEVWEIAEMAYSTSNIVSAVFLDGSMYEARIFGRKFTSFPGFPSLTSRLIWGFLYKPSTPTPNLYMVSWEATQDDVNNSKNSVPTITKIF